MTTPVFAIAHKKPIESFRHSQDETLFDIRNRYFTYCRNLGVEPLITRENGEETFWVGQHTPVVADGDFTSIARIDLKDWNLLEIHGMPQETAERFIATPADLSPGADHDTHSWGDEDEALRDSDVSADDFEDIDSSEQEEETEASDAERETLVETIAERIREFQTVASSLMEQTREAKDSERAQQVKERALRELRAAQEILRRMENRR